MRIDFPSSEFDDAVTAVCHGELTDDQARGLNELLRREPAARDAYLLRVEVHARLASDPDLFASPGETPSLVVNIPERVAPIPLQPRSVLLALSLAACFALLAGLLWSFGSFRTPRRSKVQESAATSSKAVAMLNGAVNARWSGHGEAARLGAGLEPGWLRLESGLAQLVFYSGARVVMEGPAEIRLVSRNEAVCQRGRVVADVPPQARGFRITTPHTSVTDLGTSFGVEVKEERTEVQVFKGRVELQREIAGQSENVEEGSAAVIGRSGVVQRFPADPAAFASIFTLREKSVSADALRYDQWRTANQRANTDSSLIVHFDFGSLLPSGWQLKNMAGDGAFAGVNGPDAVVVGCQPGEGRWREKRALEFRSVSDRVRLNLPGEYDSLTLTAWLSVKGLDRKINSLFMCDGFEPGTVHWLIRNDGVPGLTVIGPKPFDYQIITGLPVLTLDKFGMWQHLAVVLDGPGKEAVHYLNGVQVGRTHLRIAPPFRLGAAELGNWNPKGFPEDDPFMIRNFSGAMDEFCLFSRPLDANEIRRMYEEGKPQNDTLVAH